MICLQGAFSFHRKLRPMKQKTLREDAHSREAETCRKRPRSARECAKAHSFSCGKIYNSSGTMQNIQFRKYSLQIGTICHIFPDFFLCRLLSNSLILLYNNFNRVPDRERARLGGSSYEEYSVYCIGGGSIYQNRRSGRRCRIPSKMF